MIKPPTNRAGISNCVCVLPDNSRILEIGMTRQEGSAGAYGDGFSTILFSWYVANKGGSLISIDINPDYIVLSTKIIKEHEISLDNIHLVCGDAIQFIRNYPIQNIDLLYLDAWDWNKNDEDKKTSENMHLEFFRLVEDNLTSSAYVIIDDIFDKVSYAGKGKLLIPYMIDSGKYTLLEDGYQFVFKKNENNEEVQK